MLAFRSLAIWLKEAANTPTSSFDCTLISVERSPEELQVGASLARDIVSGTGILLLAKGSKLDENCLRALFRYYAIDPPAEGIFVWEKVKKR